MKKIFIFILVGLMLFSFASSSTVKVTKWGVDVLQTDDNSTEFKRILFADYPECHNGRANATYHNYSRILDMNCHINFNNTNPVLWEDLIINFDSYSPSFNDTQPFIIYDNNSIVTFDKVEVSSIGNGSSGTKMIGMDTELLIGSCTPLLVAPSLTVNNFGSSTKTNLLSFTQLGFNYHENGTKITDSNKMAVFSNFFCNASMNDTAWFSTQPLGLTLPNTRSGISYFHDIDTLTSKNPVTWVGGMYINNAVRATLKHNVCFTPFQSRMSGRMDNSHLDCGAGNNLGYAFLGNFYMNFTDSYLSSTLFQGFFSDWDTKIFYSIKNDMKNQDGEAVNITYNITDNIGNEYSGSGTSINENILFKRYTTSGDTDGMPLKVTITNSSYFGIKDFVWEMTTNNRGLLPMLKIPHSIRLNPLSSYLLTT